MPNIKGNKSIILSTQQKKQIVKEHFDQKLTFHDYQKNIKYLTQQLKDDVLIMKFMLCPL